MKLLCNSINMFESQHFHRQVLKDVDIIKAWENITDIPPLQLFVVKYVIFNADTLMIKLL